MSQESRIRLEHPTLNEAFRVWLKIGLTNFGGPAGQIAMMHRVLVEEKCWIGEHRFLHALNYCMLLPGPEAQQLAVYVGWILHRTPGGLIAGILFVLPGAFVIWLLSVLYTGFQELLLVQAMFYGVKAAVLALVVEACLRIGKRSMKNAHMAAIAAMSFCGLFFLGLPFPAIILAAGIIGYLGGRFLPEKFALIRGREPDGSLIDSALDNGLLEHTRPSSARNWKILAICLTLWFAPMMAAAVFSGIDSVYFQSGIFYSKMAVVTFGGAYAVLAYVAQEAVNRYAWLSPGEMLDGLGLAETTPGPLILVLQFVGFVSAFRHAGTLDPFWAGTINALLTTWVTFVPCFLWIFLGAPYVEILRDNSRLSATLSAITAAVVGVILNLAVWFGLHVVFADVQEYHASGLKLLSPVWATLDPWALLLAFAAMMAMFRYKIGMLPVLAACAGAGMIVFHATH